MITNRMISNRTLTVPGISKGSGRMDGYRQYYVAASGVRAGEIMNKVINRINCGEDVNISTLREKRQE